MSARQLVTTFSIVLMAASIASADPMDEAMERAWVDIILDEPRPAWRSRAFGPAGVEQWPELPALVPPGSAPELGRMVALEPGNLQRGDLLVFGMHSEDHTDDWPASTGVALIVAVRRHAVIVDVVDDRYRTHRRILPLAYLMSPAEYGETVPGLPLLVGGLIRADSVHFRVLPFEHDIDLAVRYCRTNRSHSR